MFSLVCGSLGPLLTTSSDLINIPFSKYGASSEYSRTCSESLPYKYLCSVGSELWTLICWIITSQVACWPGIFNFSDSLDTWMLPPLPLLTGDCFYAALSAPGGNNNVVNISKLSESDNISVNALTVFSVPAFTNSPRSSTKTPPISLAPTPPSYCLISSCAQLHLTSAA